MERLEGSDRRAAGLVALWVAAAGLVGGPIVANQIENSLEDRVAENSQIQQAEAAGAVVSVNGRTAHIAPGTLTSQELATLMDNVGDIDGIRSIKLTDPDADDDPEGVAAEAQQQSDADKDEDPEVASVTQVPEVGDASGDSDNAGSDGVNATSFVDTSLIAAPTITQPPEMAESTTVSTTVLSTTTASTTITSTTTDPSSGSSTTASEGTASAGNISGSDNASGQGLAGGRTLTAAEQAELQVAAAELDQLLGEQNIEFLFSTAVPTEASQNLLMALIELMERNDVLELHIVGHTDGIGNAAANQQLSLDRAQSIANHLIIGGIDAMRMTVEGQGSGDPVAGNETGIDKQHNRRVDIAAKGLKS